jgi:hypothetical protein
MSASAMRPSAVLRQGLRLHAAEHGRAAAFVAVGVRQLADDVFIAPPAMRQDAAQVALRAGGHEQRRLLAGDGGDALLQRVDGGVVAKHVVAYLGAACMAARMAGVGG